jgi:hypothetical protein
MLATALLRSIAVQTACTVTRDLLYDVASAWADEEPASSDSERPALRLLEGGSGF